MFPGVISESLVWQVYEHIFFFSRGNNLLQTENACFEKKNQWRAVYSFFPYFFPAENALATCFPTPK
jgi:hypothetical protein